METSENVPRYNEILQKRVWNLRPKWAIKATAVQFCILIHCD